MTFKLKARLWEPWGTFRPPLPPPLTTWPNSSFLDWFYTFILEETKMNKSLQKICFSATLNEWQGLKMPSVVHPPASVKKDTSSCQNRICAERKQAWHQASEVPLLGLGVVAITHPVTSDTSSHWELRPLRTSVSCNSNNRPSLTEQLWGLTSLVQYLAPDWFHTPSKGQW
jgi:hypothetical protein